MKSFDEIDLEAELNSVTEELTAAVSVFAQGEHGNPTSGTHILTNSSYWTVTVPHAEIVSGLMGTCCILLYCTLCSFHNFLPACSKINYLSLKLSSNVFLAVHVYFFQPPSWI